MDILTIVTTVCVGLLIGVEFAVSIFVNPILKKLDIVAQTEATRLFARRLGAAMPFWYIASMVLLVVETIVNRHGRSLDLLGVATGLWAIVIVLSIVSLVPINNRLARTDAQRFSETERREHGRWDTLHRVRVALLTVAMIAFLAGVRN